MPLVWHLDVLQGQRAFRIRLYGSNCVKEIHSLHADEVVGTTAHGLKADSFCLKTMENSGTIVTLLEG